MRCAGASNSIADFLTKEAPALPRVLLFQEAKSGERAYICYSLRTHRCCVQRLTSVTDRNIIPLSFRCDCPVSTSLVYQDAPPHLNTIARFTDVLQPARSR